MLATMGMAACTPGGAPPPVPTAQPRPSPTLMPDTPALFDESTEQVVEAFTAEVRMISDRAWEIATAPCERLEALGGELPIMTTELRITAQTLDRLADEYTMFRSTATLIAVRTMMEQIGDMGQNVTACGLLG